MKTKINWDAWGVATSVACAIHCAALPLFFTSLPLLGVNIIHNIGFEIGMVFLALCIGLYSFYHGYKKHHHSLKPMLVFCIGFVFLALKLVFIQYDTWLLIPGVAGIVYAHLINYKACRLHNHAHKEDCNHEDYSNENAVQ